MNVVEETLLIEAIKDAGAHFGGVIHLMVNGVAFPVLENRKQYIVFSHEGDELGILPTADINYAITFMKRRGRPVGKLVPFAPPGGKDPGLGFSFAWIGWHPFSKHLAQRGIAIKQDFLKGLA